MGVLYTRLCYHILWLNCESDYSGDEGTASGGGGGGSGGSDGGGSISRVVAVRGWALSWVCERVRSGRVTSSRYPARNSRLARP